jgi:hypothetical protein
MSWFGWQKDVTLGVLVAGRVHDVSGFECGQVRALSRTIAAIGEKAGLTLVAVPADQDMSDENVADEDEAMCSMFVGVLAAAGGAYEPVHVAREAMTGALEKARAIPAQVWDEITGAYREAGGKYASEDDLRVRLCCTGPLPMAYLVFGVTGPEGEAHPGAFKRGQGPEQEPHEIGVYGQDLAHSSYDGSSADPFDVGDEAHAARVREIPNGGYYLIARFD